MPEEVKHAKVTEEQVELWLAAPVTKSLISCLEWRRADSIENAGTGRLVDSSSADLTHAMLHQELGKQLAYADAVNMEAVLDHYGLIYHKPKEENDGD